MELSQTELKILDQVVKGNKHIDKIATAIQKSSRQTYTATSSLRTKGIIKLQKGNIYPQDKLHIATLLILINSQREPWKFLAGSAITTYVAFLEPHTVQEANHITGLSVPTIYKHSTIARRRNILRRKGKNYVLNEKIWPELKEFLEALRTYEQKIDQRIPLSAIIYHKTKEEVVFSCREKVNATVTAFSAYDKYGIQLYGYNNYYVLPKQTLSVDDILTHSIYTVEKTKSIRSLIYIALLYLKEKNTITIKHEVLENLKKILYGEIIKGYPSLQEIKDRAQVYKLEV